MINVVNVTQHYGVRPVLKDFNFEVKRGELVALMGPNGVGKSTLMGAMAGILSPQKGYVEIDGLRSSPETELAVRRKEKCRPCPAAPMW